MPWHKSFVLLSRDAVRHFAARSGLAWSFARKRHIQWYCPGPEVAFFQPLCDSSQNGF